MSHSWQAQAAGIEWDAIVIGAGPAGAVAARALALRGKRVLLVDRAEFPRQKVCGCCLSARTLAALGRQGLCKLCGALGGRKIEALELRSGSRRARLALPGGMALSRRALDSALATAAAQAGAAWMPATAARIGAIAGGFREVMLRPPQNGEESIAARARLVLDASGLEGPSLSRDERGATAPGSRLGAGVMLESAGDAIPPGAILMACGAGGYIGLARVEASQLVAAAAFDPAFVKRSGGLGAAACGILAACAVQIPQGLAAAPWRGTPLLSRSPGRVAAVRCLTIGDASGYVEPFTGEGIAWAIESAEAVLPLALASLAARDWDASIECAWTQRVAQSARTRRLVRGLAWTLRHPRATRAAVSLLALAPTLARPFVFRAQGSPAV